MSTLNKVILLLLAAALPVAAQDVRVSVGKHSTAIPKVCESVVPASMEGTVDVPALVKEAICKGAGDMMIDYTYVMNLVGREKDKKGNEKETSTTYEVLIPTLKSGIRTKGVLVVTNRNGVPVSPEELDKERLRAAKRIEDEEEKIARETPVPEKTSNSAGRGTPASSVMGMLPLGMYARSGINRSSFGIGRGSAVFDVRTILTTCDFTFLRRESRDGRESLVFKFTPRPDAQFNDNEKYVGRLTGEIWIDAQERIVSRLSGWPAVAETAVLSGVEKVRDQGGADATGLGATGGTDRRPPAVRLEMLRLPTGVWLPQLTRINGADYPKFFAGITLDSTGTYSNYIRFSTEVKEVNVESSKKP